MRPINHCLGAANFFELHTRIIRILEPVKSPETAITERSCREIEAMISLPIASVRIAHPRAVELLGAPLREQTDTPTGNREIELVIS
jgi:hypothetical protein